MTDTTQTFWDVNGISLQTYAFNIETLGGDREAPPSVRGSNLKVPFRPGEVWVPKVEESRTITLGMWVIGAELDGTVPTTRDQFLTFQRNWRELRQLLWGNPRQQSTLTKRFWVPAQDLEDAGVDTTGMTAYYDHVLYSAEAKVEWAGGLVPRMTGGTRAAFTVDLRLADPFFVGPEIEIPFSLDEDPGSEHEIFVLGDARTTLIQADLTGPITEPVFTNHSASGDLWMRYAVVDDSETATIDVDRFSASHDPGGVPFKSSGWVQHDGDKFWFYLNPGLNEVELTATSGTGEAVLKYRPRWF